MQEKPKRVTIKIPELDGFGAFSRSVLYGGALSHEINEAALQKLLIKVRRESWKRDKSEGAAIGVELYDFINGDGKLRSIIDDAQDKLAVLYVYVDVDSKLSHLPFELMNDGKRFLFIDDRRHLIRKVSDDGWFSNIKPESRVLKMVFMACSPTDLEPVLDYEQEEQTILRATENYSLDIRFEDSGSLGGLKHTLIENKGCDILHITGHADIDDNRDPVFYMEDETGLWATVTPDDLWEAIKDRQPTILFLSGCYTGKGNGAGESFAYQMVKKGIPAVLGWGIPVSDDGAAAFTAELYRCLSIGKGIGEAVQSARSKFEKEYHPWPMLRLFTNGEPLSPFITGDIVDYHPKRISRYEYLEGIQVKVLREGFIGRRREIQQGIRAIQGKPITGKTSKYGAVIHGTAGNGKSCLAGKLLERFNKKELFVVHGEIKEADIINGLSDLFNKLGDDTATALLSSDIGYDNRIKELFRGAFIKEPVIIYFDDFEQNLEFKGGGYVLKPEPLKALKPFLIAVHWAGHKTNLLITSRYTFKLVDSGKDLPSLKLEDISMMAFQYADLDKKIEELTFILNSKNKVLYLKYGGGNPRLLELFNKIAEEEGKYDLIELERKIKNEQEDYIQLYLADVIANAAGDDFKEFLCRASVYRIPVTAEAFKDFGDTAFLKQGVALTLLEKEITGAIAHYWVTPIIRQDQWHKLNDVNKQKQTHKIAYDWFDKIINDTLEDSEQARYKYRKEAVHHALNSGETSDIRNACYHAITLGDYMEQLIQYRDKLSLLKEVADKITVDIITEAINEKDANVSILLNNLGYSFNTLGEYEKAIEYCEKALEIDLASLGDKHPIVARDFNNIGGAWYSLGEHKKSIDYFEKALKIDLVSLGDKYPIVATDYNNIGAAWKYLDEHKKAIYYYEKALKIDLVLLGDKHSNVARDYNNIGMVWYGLGENKKAIEYCEKALEINLASLGDKHPNVASGYNNIGLAWNGLGEYKKTIKYYNKALAIFTDVFGDNHPSTKTCKNNLEIAKSELAKHLLKINSTNNH
ncbi:MAG: tetratricopeptide repeat protein [Nitrospirae bacterium]|nr:tetratricopeptide repeat protein [Nitrospirota bacterium]